MKKLIIITFILFASASTGHNKWWKIYFTTPGAKNSTPLHALIYTIKNTKRYFYGAFYELKSSPIINEFIKAKKRGIDIRLIVEQDNAHSEKIILLQRAGIKIKTDDCRGLMHHKFAIIDDMYVWTGSTNITPNGFFRNNNNAIKIYSKKLTKIFLRKFNNMFTYHIFCSRRSSPFSILRKKYYVDIDGTPVNVYFSPSDNIEQLILEELKKAKKSIIFMAFSFTSDAIGETLIDKFHQGVKVYGIFEKRGSNSRYSEYVKMKIEGLPVKLDKNRKIMHHKVIVIDEKLVLTGSYNFSKNANKNNEENILFINNKHIATQYIKEFKRLYR